ncbi:MAG: transposase [Clostridiales bacterium]|nr:transposase [Clostridiales bacterium]
MSFFKYVTMPPADIRDLRELCRYRLKLTYMRTSEKNRFQNSMTISKVRLDSIFSDPFGKSASAIMEYLISTEPDKVKDTEILGLISHRGNVKASDEDILGSIHGYEFIGVQRDKLQIINMHLSQINQCIAMIDEKLDYYRQKYASIISHLTTVIGITSESALYILGEIGTDMSIWRDDASLACWAGLSPANNASAGKKKSTKVGNGGHYLKPLLVQCALAAAKSTKKDPYFHNKYETLKKRRGHKRPSLP